MIDWLQHCAAVAVTAIVIDSLFGWPDRLYQRLSHPVVWMGKLINVLEPAMNKGGPARRLLAGGAMTAICLAAAFFVGATLQRFAALMPASWLIEGILCWPLLAIRSMREHVEAVITPLQAQDLPAARHAVSMIVGRDVSNADEAAISRAAMESLAENTSDGIIAPIFWVALGGLPAILTYKTINTLDSMIGYRKQRYLFFGRIAARLDDLVNLIPARLTALLFALCSRNFGPVWLATKAQAGQHRSPNAGWPEAAMAQAIGVRLSGPRNYGATTSNDPWLNPDAPDPDAASIKAGIGVLHRSVGILAAFLAVIALFP